jgi:hypothetical protein
MVLPVKARRIVAPLACVDCVDVGRVHAHHEWRYPRDGRAMRSRGSRTTTFAPPRSAAFHVTQRPITTIADYPAVQRVALDRREPASRIALHRSNTLTSWCAFALQSQ